MYCSNHPYSLVKIQAIRNNKNVAKFLDVIRKKNAHHLYII